MRAGVKSEETEKADEKEEGKSQYLKDD